MARLKILTGKDPALRKKSRTVEAITPRTLTLLDDMLETMRHADGVGLAAPQIGVLRRIVVIEVEEGKVIELINPEIVKHSGEKVDIEGCLSVPGEQGLVKRPAYVKVEALDRHGRKRSYEATGLLAKCFCHELDHLEGILYTDKAIRMLTPEEAEEFMNEDGQ